MRWSGAMLWLLCGALDAAYATTLAVARAADPLAMWRGVAAGPLGDAAKGWGAGGVVAGLGVHFALMAAMVAAGLWLARGPLARLAPWLGGTLYGLALYAVMYGLVLPARFGVPFPNPDTAKLLLGLAPHIAFVGLPLFTLGRRAS